MKLTKREKGLLIGLSLIVVIGGYYNFLFKPQISKIKGLENEVNKHRARIEQIKIDSAENSQVNKDYKKMNAKIKTTTERLFPSIKQEKIIVILDDFISKSNLDGISISFSEISVDGVEVKKEEVKDMSYLLKTLAEEYIDPKNKNSEASDNKNTETKSNDSEKIEKMTATINYKGKYNDIKNFISEIEKYDKKIIMSNITFSKSGSGKKSESSSEYEDSQSTTTSSNEEDSISGSIALDFYSVPKIHNQDAEYLKWDFKNGYGKDDPFLEFSGYTSKNSSDAKKEAIQTTDFIMGVKPISSDLPSVILGRAMDKLGKTYVYADNEQFENVEFQLIQEGKKYFYKYKTESENYPKNYDTEKEEFNPHGNNVNLNIISNIRNDEDDNSGVNLTLINKTNLNLNVAINYDDKKKPRVKIVKKSGNITIIK